MLPHIALVNAERMPDATEHSAESFAFDDAATLALAFALALALRSHLHLKVFGQVKVKCANLRACVAAYVPACVRACVHAFGWRVSRCKVL